LRVGTRARRAQYPPSGFQTSVLSIEFHACFSISFGPSQSIISDLSIIDSCMYVCMRHHRARRFRHSSSIRLDFAIGLACTNKKKKEKKNNFKAFGIAPESSNWPYTNMLA
jgi:hypothetical protein